MRYRTSLPGIRHLNYGGGRTLRLVGKQLGQNRAGSAQSAFGNQNRNGQITNSQVFERVIRRNLFEETRPFRVMHLWFDHETKHCEEANMPKLVYQLLTYKLVSNL
jgi:hypothetical protein